MWQSNEEVLLKVSSGQIVSDSDLNRRLPSKTLDGFAELQLGCDPTLKARGRCIEVSVILGVSQLLGTVLVSESLALVIFLTWESTEQEECLFYGERKQILA